MALEVSPGPVLNPGQSPQLVSGLPPPDYNPDRAPSGSDLGWGVVDPRYAVNGSGWMNVSGEIGGTAPNPIGIVNLSGSGLVGNDQAPSTASTTNIAGTQAGSSTALTLVSSSGAGITVMASALTIPQTGKVVPSGTLCIDSLPALISFGQTGAIAVPDPRTTMARAVAAVAAAGATATTLTVAGFDLYGNPQTEAITLSAGATVNGKKGWKFITSATLNATDAGHNYSLGTADIYEFPYRVDASGYASVSWNNAPVTSLTFVAADTTSPATSTTGSVRGTWVPPSSADGTKKAQTFISQSPQNLATLTSVSTVGLFGVTPA